MFDKKYFEELDGRVVLKDGIEVHHIDLNHNNNDISNLLPLTKSEHIRIHNILTPHKRNSITGQFEKSIKQ